MSCDITTGNLKGTTNLPAFNACSFSAWVRLSTSTPPDYTLAAIDDAAVHFTGYGRNGAGATGSLALFNDTVSINVRTHAQLVNTWTWVAWSTTGGVLNAYYSTNGVTINSVGNIALSTGTPTGKFISTDGFGDPNWSGLIVAAKFFGASLTIDQLALEAIRHRPSQNINTWLPMLNDLNNGVDWSGQADMTPTGSFTASRLMPPIPWKG